MAKSMELAFQIKSNMDSSVISSFKSAENAMKAMENQMKALKSQEKALKGFESLKKGANEAHKNLILTNKEIVNASKKLQGMKEAYEKSGRSNKELNKAIKEQEKHIAKLNVQAERQKKAFHAARSEVENSKKNMEQYGTTLDKTREQMKKLEVQQARIKKLDKLQTGLNDTGEKTVSSGRSQMMSGAAQGAAVTIPVKLFMDVEESQADLKKMIDFASKQEEEAYSKIFRDLSDRSGLAQTQIFEITGALAQSDIDKVDLPDYTEQAMKMKVAFDITEAAAGDFLAKTQTQLGLSKKELFEYADTINYLADSTSAQADQLMEISNSTGSIAKIASVSKESHLALGASLLSMNTGQEVASTGLKNFYVGLTAGESATNRQAAAYKKLGLSATQVNKDMVKDADKTMVDVLERINKLPKELQTATIKDLFGKESLESVSKMADNVDEVKKNMALAQDKMKKQDSVNKEYATRMNTLTNQLKKAFTRLMNVGADLGKSLAPAIRDILSQIEPVMKKVSEWVQKNPQLTATILKIVAAMAAFNLTMGASKLAFGHLFIMAGKAVGLFKRFQMFKAAGGLAKIGPAIAKIGMAIKGVFAALMAGNPIAWIIAGIVAVVAGFVLLYKKSEWFRNGVNKAFNMIKPHAIELGNVIKNYIGKAFEKLKEYADKYGPKLKEAFDKMKPAIKVIGKLIVVGIIKYIKLVIFNIKMIVKVFKFLWPAIKMIGKILLMSIFKPITLIKLAFKAVWNVIKAVGKAIVSFIVREIHKAKIQFNLFKAGVTYVFNAIKNTAKSVFNAVVGFVVRTIHRGKMQFNLFKAGVNQVWDSIKTKASDIWNSILTKVKDFIKNFKDAIKDAIDWVKEKWNDITNLKMPSLSSFFLGGGQEQKADGRYTGDSYYKGGMTWLAERGREVVKYPSGQIALVNNKSMGYLPKGTKIFNNSATEKMLNPKNTITERVDNLKERFQRLVNSNNSTTVSYGGNNITININTTSDQDPRAIAREAVKLFKEELDKNRRKEF